MQIDAETIKQISTEVIVAIQKERLENSLSIRKQLRIENTILIKTNASLALQNIILKMVTTILVIQQILELCK